MSPSFNFNGLLSRSNMEEKEDLLSIDDEHGSPTFQSNALKIQNPDATTLRVLSRKEEKLREKTLHRLVKKNGTVRTRTRTGVRMKAKKFIDIFTTIMEWSWPRLISFICFMYFADWILFACCWHLLAWIFNDLTEEG